MPGGYYSGPRGGELARDRYPLRGGWENKYRNINQKAEKENADH